MIFFVAVISCFSNFSWVPFQNIFFDSYISFLYSNQINSFVRNAPCLYPWKHQKTLCFQGVWRSCILHKWVKCFCLMPKFIKIITDTSRVNFIIMVELFGVLFHLWKSIFFSIPLENSSSPNWTLFYKKLVYKKLGLR